METKLEGDREQETEKKHHVKLEWPQVFPKKSFNTIESTATVTNAS